MRSRLAVVAPLLGGCSFIYNPDHINRDVDANVVDVERVVDVNPAGLSLSSAFPATIYEGVGTGGARPALVVIRGEDIAPNATVTVVPTMGDPSLVVLNDFKIAEDHRWIALSLSVPVDAMHDETGAHAAPALSLALTVDNGLGHSVTMPTDALKLQWLDQLATAPTALPDPATRKRYSVIDIAAAASFAADPAAHRIELHAVSSIHFHAGIVASAAGTKPGPGGCAGGAGAGGAATTADGSTCSPGTGTTTTISAGGGGGFAVAGDPGSVAGGDPTGEPQIISLATNAGGGGGGGGGGAGAGGGGTVYLEAGGDLTVTKSGTSSITVAGATGTSGSLNLSGGGGGGTGGTILLRAGGTLSIDGALVVSGGGGGGGISTGGAAHEGRVRFDAGTGTAPAGYQGPMIQAVPYFTTTQLTADGAILVTGPAGNTSDFKGLAYDKDGAPVTGSNFDLLFGQSTAKPRVMLTPGYNRVCVLVPGGNVLTKPESGNCGEIAFLP